MATRQNKSSVYLLILLQQLLQLCLKNNHTIRYFFHVLILIVNPICLPKIEFKSHLIKR